MQGEGTNLPVDKTVLCMDVRVGPYRRLSMKELMHLSCGVGELLRIPWTARRVNQSILKEISPEYSLEGLMLKLQYFDHLMGRASSLEKTLMLGKTEGKKEEGATGDEMVEWHHRLNKREFAQAPGDGKGQGSLVCCSPRGHKESDTTESLNNNKDSVRWK